MDRLHDKWKNIVVGGEVIDRPTVDCDRLKLFIAVNECHAPRLFDSIVEVDCPRIDRSEMYQLGDTVMATECSVARRCLDTDLIEAVVAKYVYLRDRKYTQQQLKAIVDGDLALADEPPF